MVRKYKEWLNLGFIKYTNIDNTYQKPQPKQNKTKKPKEKNLIEKYKRSTNNDPLVFQQVKGSPERFQL